MASLVMYVFLYFGSSCFLYLFVLVRVFLSLGMYCCLSRCSYGFMSVFVTSFVRYLGCSLVR